MFLSTDVEDIKCVKVSSTPVLDDLLPRHSKQPQKFRNLSLSSNKSKFINGASSNKTSNIHLTAAKAQWSKLTGSRFQDERRDAQIDKDAEQEESPIYYM